jgi:glycosyltransferase involved in cell wall biosynthesis
MASGVPVIATRVGGNAELVEDGATGTLIETGDVDSLARAMLEYASTPARVIRHGVAGRARVEDSFSLDAMVAQYTMLYERLVTHRRGARQLLAAAASRPATGGH